MSERRGWFADTADDTDPRWPWRPYLQCDGMCLPLAISFATEAECEAFIRDDVVAKPLLPAPDSV